jgi:hypothetical protein
MIPTQHNINISQHPKGARFSIAFDADAAVEGDYQRVMSTVKNCGIKVSLNDVRSFEGKSFVDLEELKADVSEGALDFGWYMTHGHRYGNGQPTPCFCPSHEVIDRWEDEHERKCSVMVFPCGFRDHADQFEGVFFARESIPSAAQADWSKADLHDFPITEHWGGHPVLTGVDYSEHCLEKSIEKMNFEAARGGVYINFVHWHWLSGLMNKIDTWDGYLTLLQEASRRKDAFIGSVPEIVEYRWMLEHCVVTKTSNGTKFALNDGVNHRFKPSDTKMSMAFLFPELRVNDRILINGSPRRLSSNHEKIPMLELPASEFPVLIS